ncbi:MAG TPA: VWA domain-containing protein [Phycisphaerales bacterium]|nr:VWA domain-containing protein [Phycisphaerales bacterium]
MTFLAPLPAIIAACICVPALLALYLLKLRRRPVRVGSVLFWPKATEDTQANVPLRMIRPSLLLLLHLLALAALLIAFARPVISGDARDAQRIVLLIDASASMSAIDAADQPARLDRAKRRATEVVRESRSITGSRAVAVVSFAHAAEARTGFTSSTTVATAAIDAIEPTDQPGNLAEALALIETLAATTGETEDAAQEPPTIILLSDGSFAASEKPFDSRFPVQFERIGPADNTAIDNVGVTAFAARRDATNLRTVRVLARVQSTISNLDVPLTLALDGTPIERRAVRIGTDTSPLPADLEVSFDISDLPAGVLTLAIDRPDALASDNLASAVLPPPVAPRIILVRDALPASPSRDASFLLSDVLEELNPQSLRIVSPAALATERTDASFTTNVDLLVLDGVSVPVAPGVPTLSFGEGPTLANVQSTPAQPVRTGSLFWNREHPLMRGVTLDALTIATARSITSQPPARIEPIARSDDRVLIALAQASDAEHILVSFDLLDSNWPLQAGFPVFVANATDYLTRRTQRINAAAFSTSQLASISLARTSGVTIAGPIDITPPTLAQQPPGTISLGTVARAGLYIVRPALPSSDRAVAINLLSPLESALASPSQVQVDGKPLDSVTTGRGQREIWHWFILIACGLLVIEWIVYATRVRA